MDTILSLVDWLFNLIYWYEEFSLPLLSVAREISIWGAALARLLANLSALPEKIRSSEENSLEKTSGIDRF